MKKSIFKKIIVSVLALSLIFSFSTISFAGTHAANGADVVSKNLNWYGFSVCDEPETEWMTSLKKAMDEAKEQALKDKIAGKITEDEYNAQITEIDGWMSYTEGWIEDSNSSNVKFYCKNSGWDGEYAAQTYGGKKVLVGDNPWGLTLTMDKIPVEYGRYYTLDFKIASELEKEIKNEAGQKSKVRMKKHALVKAYDYQSKGGPAASVESFTVNGEDGNLDGTFDIPKTEKDGELNYAHIQMKFKIPDSKDYWSGGKDSGAYTSMGVKFALGAFLKSQEKWEEDDKEVALKGYVYVKDLKVLAGDQYSVKYYDGGSLKATKYVNPFEKAPKIAMTKKGYTLDYYTNMATGAKYSFGSVMSDLNLKAHWIKTPKPAKAKFTAKSKKKKKVTVTFKKNTNAKGYQVKYSYSKKFSKKKKFKTKTKTANSTKSYTIKSLKRSSVVYVKARAFNKDSTGAKVYGKWSKRKSAFVK